jgi:FK506-binding protein 4/5
MAETEKEVARQLYEEETKELLKQNEEITTEEMGFENEASPASKVVEKDDEIEEANEDDEVGKEEDLTSDGGVKKKILTKGTGRTNPEKGTEVKVHYTGKLEDGTVFDSSVDRGEPFSFKLGVGQVIKGWDTGVASMKKGEKALLTCRAEYAYGEAGSPPKIPSNATLLFEVELLEWLEETDVTEAKDGGVMKKTLKEGDGWKKPTDDAAVTINLKIFSLEGTLLEEKSEFKFTLGEEEVPLGLDTALQQMKKGEHSRFHIKPKYLTESAFEIPLDRDIIMEVELLEFTEEKQNWEMNTEEKLEISHKRREEGNRLYQKQKFERAIKKYQKALDSWKYENDKTDHESQVNALKLPCHLNIAACFLKLKKYKDVQDHCNKALDIDSKSIKALYRRGVANSELDNWDQAKMDLSKALEIDPENKEVKKELLKLNKKIKAQNKKEMRIFSGMFEKFSREEEKEAEQKKEAEQSTETEQKTETENEASKESSEMNVDSSEKESTEMKVDSSEKQSSEMKIDSPETPSQTEASQQSESSDQPQEAEPMNVDGPSTQNS